MPLAAPLYHFGSAGPDELALMLALLIAALAALYFALRMPSLPEYQRDDEEPEERR